ncbi:hypothetical protein FB645_005865 [Coemansia sp. IMI 203386]|nr:hypothetical protein FB645_005865 [Coemansia sp. IMI 203386]
MSTTPSSPNPEHAHRQQHERLLRSPETVYTDDIGNLSDSLPGSPITEAMASPDPTHNTLTPCDSRVLLGVKNRSATVSSKNSEFSSSYASSDQTTRSPHQVYHEATDPSKSKNEKPAGHSMSTRLRLSFVGLFFTIFLSGLDQTVTSTMLTRIADDFRALDRVEWVPTIFMLCSTCMNILSGRIADVFGRFSVLLFCLVAFVAGAAVSASAQSIVVFIAARGISGIACGGMLNLSIIIISDIVSIERRGKYLGFLQICFGISSAAGPLIGGLFADHLSWRAAFFTDMIVGFVTIVYLAVILRLPKPSTKIGWKKGVSDFDYVGVGTVIAGISLLIVGLNMGGTIQRWSSPATIGCLVSACVLLVVFVGVEIKIPQYPLVPMWIFTVRNLVIAFLVTFLCAMTMFSIIFFMPVYFSAVFGASAMRAGLLSLPFGIALSISSFATGYFMSRDGIYRLFLRTGPAIMAIGVLLLAILSGKTSQATQSVLLIIPGLGMGNVMVANVIAAQASTDPRLLSTITPLCEFFLSIGGVVGVAIFGAVYRNKLWMILSKSAAQLTPALQEMVQEARKDVGTAYADGVPQAVTRLVADGYIRSMKLAFWGLLPFLCVAFLLSLLQKKTPAHSKSETAEDAATTDDNILMEAVSQV